MKWCSSLLNPECVENTIYGKAKQVRGFEINHSYKFPVLQTSIDLVSDFTKYWTLSGNNSKIISQIIFIIATSIIVWLNACSLNNVYKYIGEFAFPNQWHLKFFTCALVFILVKTITDINKIVISDYF